MNTTGERVLDALQQHKLKRQHDGSYRCNSPFRAGSNSGAFAVTIDQDGEHGAYYDHVSGESGSLYDLARRLGIELPIVAPAMDTKRAYTGRSDFARVHGVPDEAYALAKWVEVVKDNRPALEFPTNTGARWRFLDGRKPVYKSSTGYKRCWYGLNGTFWQRVAAGAPIVYCNGEASVVAAQWHGLAAVCVTAGEREIPAELLQDLVNELNELKGARPEIIVALDCDETGRQTALAIKAQFVALGFAARAVDLGLSRGGDIADFCSLYAGKVLEALQARPDLPDDVCVLGEPYRFMTLDDVLAQPPIEWLVKGIIPRKALVMVFGQSGSHKTFFVLGIAYQLAFTVPVVYVAVEGGPGMRQRLEALVKFNGGKKPPFLSFVQGTIDLFDGGAAERFRMKLEALKPALLVVDTFAGSTGDADENKGRDMNRILANLGRMSETLGVTVLLVHHTNKGGRQERGHGALFARCDTVIRLSRLDDVTLVESHKSKDSRGFDPYALREVVVSLGYRNSDGDEVTSLVLLPAESVTPAADALTAKQRALLEAVQMDGKLSYADIADVIESYRQEVYRMVKNLTRRGFLIRTVEGELKLTPSGEAVLEGSPSEGVCNCNSVTSQPHAQARDSADTPCYTCYSVAPDTAASGHNSTLFGIERNYYEAGE